MALRCLIVDDSEEFLASARGLLSTQGLQIVATAATGDDAVRLAKRHRPDVALVDVQLGEENGIEVARRLGSETPSMSVILISTHPEEDLVDLTAGTRAVGFLAKSGLSAIAVQRLVASAPRDR